MQAVRGRISEPSITRVTEGPGGDRDDSEDRRDHQDLHRELHAVSLPVPGRSQSSTEAVPVFEVGLKLWTDQTQTRGADSPPLAITAESTLGEPTAHDTGSINRIEAESTNLALRVSCSGLHPISSAKITTVAFINRDDDAR